LHRVLGAANPCESRAVRHVRTALRHQWGYRTAGHRRFGPDLLALTVLKMTGGDPVTLRDRSLFLLAFAACLGALDLRRLSVEALVWHDDVLELHKPDGIWRVRREPAAFAAYCPVRALEVWLGASGIAAGAIYRSLGAIPVKTRDPAARNRGMSHAALGRQVARRLAAAGIPPDEFGVGCFRSGFLSSAQAMLPAPFQPGMPVQLSKLLSWA
jgi:hypothetical protein